MTKFLLMGAVHDLTLFFALALFTVRSQCRVQWWWSAWAVLLKMKVLPAEKSVKHRDGIQVTLRYEI